jgi:HTH-type transcriptional regulator/antitoxin HigA
MSGHNFQPDWFSAPGGTIRDILEERGLSLRDFAKLLGLTQDRAERLLSAKEAITKDIARLLAQKLGGSEKFWMSREENYRDEVARLQSVGDNDAAKAWLQELPLKDMQKFEWIPTHHSVDKNVEACLKFFGVSDVQEWRGKYRNVLSAVSFRTSPTFKSEPGAVLAWLRYGELKAAKIPCHAWNPTGFERELINIRRLTRHKEPSQFLPLLRRLCADHGVALVSARTPTGCRASGATRFLNADKAMMLLSFRYMSDDQFWFTFFHESAHLLLHSSKALFLEDGSEVSLKEEHEANLFAQNILVPPGARSELLSMTPSKDNIMKFSVKVGLARGIVVGQLQYAGRIKPDQLNWLKRRYKLEDWHNPN